MTQHDVHNQVVHVMCVRCPEQPCVYCSVPLRTNYPCSAAPGGTHMHSHSMLIPWPFTLYIRQSGFHIHDTIRFTLTTINTAYTLNEHHPPGHPAPTSLAAPRAVCPPQPPPQTQRSRAQPEARCRKKSLKHTYTKHAAKDDLPACIV